MKLGLAILGISFFAILFLGRYDWTARHLPRQEARNALTETVLEGQLTIRLISDLRDEFDTCRFSVHDSLAFDSLYLSAIRSCSAALGVAQVGVAFANAPDLSTDAAVREAWKRHRSATQYNQKAWDMCREMQERLDVYTASPR
jgi:hypothetical protein